MRLSIVGLLLFATIAFAQQPDSTVGDIQSRFGLKLKGDDWRKADLETVASLMKMLPDALHAPLSFSKPRFRQPEPSPSLLSAFKESEHFSLARRLLQSLLERYDKKNGVSKTKDWRVISEWTRNPLFALTADNADPRGYALPKGMKNPSADFVSTALVYFLPPDSEVEASIKCRMPDKYHFIKNLFPDMASPLEHPLIQCRDMEEGLLDDLEFLDVQTGKTIDLGPITMDTVRGFEVMYATPGAGDISEIAGHLLLRIKLNNNPRADALGIENPHDLVVSCLADTHGGKTNRVARTITIQEECRKSNWLNLVENDPAGESALASLWQSLRGLTGGFLIIMDRQTLGEAVKSYTVEQDRDLLRYRLDLTEEMKRNLLDRLYVAKKNYKPKYFFFSKNCGSVLIKMIGQGIRDEDIAHFDPLVSPPHTLLGNLIRKDRATRVFPSFYSYRKQGFVAKNIFIAEYVELKQKAPEAPWPPTRSFFHRKERVRTKALAELGGIVTDQPALRLPIYRLATLAQESEMIRSHKDLICKKYTGPATAEARSVQMAILQDAEDLEGFKLNTDRLIHETYGPVEKKDYEEGTPHTQHYAWGLGVGRYQSDLEEDATVLTLRGAMLKQDMGSFSSIAMQRVSAIELGGASLIADDEGLKEWSLTGLSFRKFRDTLNQVPSVLVSTRGLGLGLSVLDFRHRRKDHKTDGIIAGFEVLGNLVSTANYNDFLLCSIGGDLKVHDYDDHTNMGLHVPVRVESLLTWKSLDRPWRNRAIFSISTRDDNSHELKLSSSISHRLGEWMRSEFVLHLSVDYNREFAAGIIEEDQDTLLGQLRLEVKRW